MSVLHTKRKAVSTRMRSNKTSACTSLPSPSTVVFPKIQVSALPGSVLFSCTSACCDRACTLWLLTPVSWPLSLQVLQSAHWLFNFLWIRIFPSLKIVYLHKIDSPCTAVSSPVFIVQTEQDSCDPLFCCHSRRCVRHWYCMCTVQLGDQNVNKADTSWK